MTTYLAPWQLVDELRAELAATKAELATEQAWREFAQARTEVDRRRIDTLEREKADLREKVAALETVLRCGRDERTSESDGT